VCAATDLPEIILDEYGIRTIVTRGAWKENCYLVRELRSGEQAVIDPGDGVYATIEAVLSHGGPLRYIWLTHAHHDHVYSAGDLCRRFGIVCDLHEDDVRLLHHAPMYALRFANKKIEAPKSFRTFNTNATFELGGRTVGVIHVPGHTSGSVGYDFGDFVFSGDTLMYEHIGRTDLPGADEERLRESVSRLLESLREAAVLFPGHGRAWTVREARTWWHDENASVVDNRT